MAVMRTDPQILEGHRAIEATVSASCTNAATSLATLKDSSWSFLQATVSAFEKDYKVFSQRAETACLVVRGFDPLFDPFCILGNEVSMNITQLKKLKNIVKK
ncbi:casein kinase i isoform delta-like protein [Hordeum vulgare]|nr:casein kinase i isoform delta-like protein [Hordeum vulgare]